MQPESAATAATASRDASPRGRAGRRFLTGLVAGLVPLGAAVIIVLVAVAAATLMRALTAGQGFSVQQGASAIALIVGVLAGAAAYVVSGVRALRLVGRWQQGGMTAQANGALWGLAVGALVVLLPLLLAVVLPQHPAPNLAP